MQHNKKRNTALVYEFLVRYITKCLIENKKSNANKAMSLVKRYFSAGPLHEELALFNTLVKEQAEDTRHAEKLLGAIVEKARNLDHRVIERRKSGLIKEINTSLEPEVLYRSKVPYYSVYASLQTLINHSNGKLQKLDGVERVQLEQKVLTFLTQERTAAKTMSEALKMDRTYNNTVYKLVINKFNQKYKDTLSESQKKLLTKYTISMMGENKKVFVSALQQELDGVKTALSFVKNNEVRNDADLMKRISECRVAASSIDAHAADEKTLTQVLKFMSLAAEVSA